MIRIALDTNVLVYAEGVERSPADGEKVRRARRLAEGANDSFAAVIAIQAFAELHEVLTHKAGLGSADVARRLADWQLASTIVPTDQKVFEQATGLAARHRLRTYDAIILAAAAEAESELLLSEDFQDGFTWRGVTVTNPFALHPDRRIARLLA